MLAVIKFLSQRNQGWIALGFKRELHSQEAKHNHLTPAGRISNSSGRNLWVSGLSSTTRATDLKNLFSKYGKVCSPNVLPLTWLGILVLISGWGKRNRQEQKLGGEWNLTSCGVVNLVSWLRVHDRRSRCCSEKECKLQSLCPCYAFQLLLNSLLASTELETGTSLVV